ncbi:MAG: DUF2232 domain-containing protein, partial [Desulfobulbaceae bacterium]|nr:DUF2232 domain-containing protein [Desulfobulbaceae bacterium]
MLTLPALSAGMAWLIFFSSLPIIYFPIALGVDKGFRIIFHAMLISCGISLLAGTSALLLLSFCMMPTGFVVARSLNRRQPVLDAFSRGSVILGMTWLLAAILISGLNNVNLYHEVLKEIDAGLVMASVVYDQAPDIPLEVKAELQPAFARIRDVTPKIFPAVLAVMTIGTVWLNILLGNWLLKKKGLTGWVDLTLWRLPEPLVWLFISAGVLLFVPGTMNVIGLNLMIIMVTLYFMQGFEILNHLCLKWSVPNLIRLLIIFFLVIQAYGFILLALLGIADTWADFRK